MKYVEEISPKVIDWAIKVYAKDQARYKKALK
jgi:hypothetical protein